MKFFLYDFSVFNDLKTHLNKLKNVKNLVLDLTLKNACFWCILVWF